VHLQNNNNADIAICLSVVVMLHDQGRHVHENPDIEIRTPNRTKLFIKIFILISHDKITGK